MAKKRIELIIVVGLLIIYGCGSTGADKEKNTKKNEALMDYIVIETEKDFQRN